MQNKNYSNSSLYILNNSSWNKWPPLYKPGMSSFENKSSGNSGASLDVLVEKSHNFECFLLRPPPAQILLQTEEIGAKIQLHSPHVPHCYLLQLVGGAAICAPCRWMGHEGISWKWLTNWLCCCLADHAKSGCLCFQTKDQRIQKNYHSMWMWIVLHVYCWDRLHNHQ